MASNAVFLLLFASFLPLSFGGWCADDEYWWGFSCYKKYDDGVCGADKLGAKSLTGDYSRCKAGVGECGCCGTGGKKVTEECEDDSSCDSKFCAGYNAVSCGVCWVPISDGQPAATRALGFDYDYCESRSGACGTCGKIPTNTSCNLNAECETGYCSTVSQSAEDVFGKGCWGKCIPKVPDGRSPICGFIGKFLNYGGCDYVQCESGTGICGVCGVKASLGGYCSRHEDCASGLCASEESTGRKKICRGICIEAREDGSTVPIKETPQNIFRFTDAEAYYDYYTCKAKSGICGQCGPTKTISIRGRKSAEMPLNSRCSSHDHCGPDMCCGGAIYIDDCNGICVNKTASVCPGMFGRIFKTAERHLKKVAASATAFGECMKEKMIAGVGDVINEQFQAHFCMDTMTASLKSGSYAKEGRRLGKARRLGKVTSDGSAKGSKLEEGPTVVSSSGAFMRVNHIKQFATDEVILPKHAIAESRQLQTSGRWTNEDLNISAMKRNFSKSFDQPCRQAGVSFCKAGAALAVHAELELIPDFNFEFDLENLEASVDMSLELKTFMGLKAKAAGTCSYNKQFSFPENPMQLLTACYGIICVSVWLQARAEVGLEGYVVANAKAAHQMKYVLSGNGNVKFDVEQGMQTIQLAKQEFKNSWMFDARGELSARVWSMVGPTISIMITPGLWTTIHPSLTAETTMYGYIALQRNSEGDLDDLSGVLDEKIEDPIVNCESSAAPGNGSKVIGAGRRLQVDPIVAKESCGQFAVSVKGALEITTMGPPFGYSYQDIAKILATICGDFSQAMANFTQKAAAAIECATQVVPGTQETLDLIQMFEGICVKVTDFFASLQPEDSIKLVANDVFCVDLVKEKIGNDACAGAGFVGCRKNGKGGWKQLEIPDGMYKWKYFGQQKCAPSLLKQLPTAQIAAACQQAARADPGCGPQVLIVGTECNCVKVGSMCNTLVGTPGKLYTREYVGMTNVKRPWDKPEEEFVPTKIEDITQHETLPFVFAVPTALALLLLAVVAIAVKRHRTKRETREMGYAVQTECEMLQEEQAEFEEFAVE